MKMGPLVQRAPEPHGRGEKHLLASWRSEGYHGKRTAHSTISEDTKSRVTHLSPLSIVIVNWNTRDHLARCLRSLHAYAPAGGAEIIVVDNASSDGSAAYVREEWPSVTLIANRENRGFAGGVNDGLHAARGAYLLVLNPDIQVHEHCLETLARFLDDRQGVAAVMPALYGSDGRPQSDYVRKLPTLPQVIFFHTMLAPAARRIPLLVRRYLEAEIPPDASSIEVAQIPGACLMTRRSVVDAVGEMDESFLLFFEDVDWCARMRSRGWTLMLDRGASATHAGGSSFQGEARIWQTGRFMVSLARYFEIHTTPLQAFLAKGLILCNSAAAVFARRVVLLLMGDDPAGERRFSYMRHRQVLSMFRHGGGAGSDPGLPVTDRAGTAS